MDLLLVLNMLSKYFMGSFMLIVVISFKISSTI